MPRNASLTIRIGVGGWNYEPWRGAFYPKGLPHSRELEYASRKLTSIEIDSTYYGSKTPEASRGGATKRRTISSSRSKAPGSPPTGAFWPRPARRSSGFSPTGVTELKGKLGPVNWQFATTKRFDPDDFGAFLKLLPASVDGLAVRHAVEVRNETFRDPNFVALARSAGVAVVIAGDSEFPQIADVTAPFVYARIMGTSEGERLGYPAKTLDLWARRAKAWAAGQAAPGLETLTPAPTSAAREVFLYVISGFKALNPAAAMALIERLG